VRATHCLPYPLRRGCHYVQLLGCPYVGPLLGECLPEELCLLFVLRSIRKEDLRRLREPTSVGHGKTIIQRRDRVIAPRVQSFAPVGTPRYPGEIALVLIGGNRVPINQLAPARRECSADTPRRRRSSSRARSWEARGPADRSETRHDTVRASIADPGHDGVLLCHPPADVEGW
jgi:hypothetical protein